MSGRLPFRLRLPVMAAPMFLVSGPDLVIAACKAGVIGAFPTPNARPIATLETWMAKITSELDAARAKNPDALIAPWCANLITHSSNARLPEDIALVAKYKPPIVVTALGSPKPALELVHSYGGLVFADVIDLKLARKAATAGVDGLACIAAGAGGHTGYISPFAFVSAVREFFDGIVVVGGGVADGAGVAGAIAAGADLVYVGTRFISSEESMAVAAYKQMVVDCTLDDLVLSAGVSGTMASWLGPSLRANGYDPQNMPAAPPRNYDSQESVAKKWVDLWAAGQGLGAIRAVEPVATIVDRLEIEYRSALGRAARLHAEMTG